MTQSTLLNLGALMLAASLLVGMIVPFACRLAHRFDFLDRPGGRKKHDDDIPPVGGLVIFPVFIALAVVAGLGSSSFWAFAAAIGLLMTVGALDDRYNLSPRVKFLAQFGAAFIIVLLGGVRVQGMGDIFGFGELWMGWMAVPFTVIAIVLLINALNLMDGLDGLAGGLGFVVCFWLLVCALAAGDTRHATLLAVMMGALAGFLFHNMRHPWRARARIFLGDAGSLSLGLTLAWFAIDMAGHPDTATMMPMTVAWLLALPIMDTCGQFARRVSQGRHPFSPDHNHFHHHFVTAGVSVRQATTAILLIVFFYGVFAATIQFAGWPQALLTYPWIILLFAHMFMSVRPRRFRKLIQRLFKVNTTDGQT
jgi:UDP-GlcNAc:undecaprenyl-phosphate GlcNAc-1-phosphate transferase